MEKKKTGIARIAEMAQVSQGTVDRALHGRPGINEETRERILEIARKIGYKPNPSARSLAIGRDIRIGVCVPREIAFFYNELWQGIHQEIERYKGMGSEFVLQPIPELGRGERSAFRTLVRASVKGIVVTPGNPDTMTPLIDEAESLGIRVVCVSTDAPESKRSAIVSVESHVNGRMAGELMGRMSQPSAKVAIVTGMLRTVDHRKKAEGFRESFLELNPGGEIVDILEAHEDPHESYEKTKHLLEAVPDLAGIYVNTVNCLPVCRALQAKGAAGRVRLITTDLFREMVPHFESGTITASMHQRPYRQGQLAVRTLAEHLLHGDELQSRYLSPTIVLRSNLSLFREANSTLPKAHGVAAPKER